MKKCPSTGIASNRLTEARGADRSFTEAHRLHKIGLYWTGLCRVWVDKFLTLSRGRIQRTFFGESVFVGIMGSENCDVSGSGDCSNSSPEA